MEDICIAEAPSSSSSNPPCDDRVSSKSSITTATSLCMAATSRPCDPRDFKKSRAYQFKSSDHPVERVSWADAVTFCRLLSELPTERAAGYQYRLPTESEWEYACRAGTETDSWFGREADRVDDAAFINANSMNRTHAVGQKKANPCGLYDMN